MNLYYYIYKLKDWFNWVSPNNWFTSNNKKTQYKILTYDKLLETPDEINL
jgi:hypothetical protein